MRAPARLYESKRQHTRAPSGSRADGVTVGTIDQTLLPHRYVTIRLETGEDAARAIKTMQVRGAPLIGAVAAYGMALALRAGCVRCGAGARLCAADRDAADRDQPEMGARRDDGGGAQPPARGSRRRRLPARRRDRRRGRRDQCGDRPARPEADRGDRRAKKPGETGQRADPLQCRLARDRRLGHRDGADLPGARQGPAGPCVGRRDAPAQSGRFAHRLGARPSRRRRTP